MMNRKRMICALVVLAMLMWTIPPARAELRGTLLRDLEWQIGFDNSASCCPTAMTIYYLGNRRVLDLENVTVPGNADVSQGRVLYSFAKPGTGVRRIIIEVDSGSIAVETTIDVTQTGGSFPATLRGFGRVVFDVE